MRKEKAGMDAEELGKEAESFYYVYDDDIMAIERVVFSVKETADDNCGMDDPEFESVTMRQSED